MTCARLLKLAKGNADRMRNANQKANDVPKRVVPKLAKQMSHVVREIGSRTVNDVLKRLVVMLAKPTNRVVTEIVVQTEIVLPKDADQRDQKGVARMANRLAMGIVVPKGKADEARCLGSLNCLIAITMAG